MHTKPRQSRVELILPNYLCLQKKKHTHVAPADGSGAGQGGVAKTFVMERGKVGRLLSQLVLDLRRVMEPHTASKLKVCTCDES